MLPISLEELNIQIFVFCVNKDIMVLFRASDIVHFQHKPLCKTSSCITGKCNRGKIVFLLSVA